MGVGAPLTDMRVAVPVVTLALFMVFFGKTTCFSAKIRLFDMTMSKKLPLQPKAREISRMRCDQHLTWPSIARKLLSDEVDAPPHYREAGDLDDPQLIHNYARAACRLFGQACQMGYETPPPAGTAFHSAESTDRSTHVPASLADRLRELQTEADATSDTHEREQLEVRVRSERQRLTNLRRRAADRVRYGRPFLDGAEAAAHLPPLVHMEGAMRVERPYPPLSDRELLGGARYDVLIAERVAEARAKPGATQRDLYLAANPHEIPLPDDLRPKSTDEMWQPVAATSDDLLETKLFLGVATTVLVSATNTWSLGRGRPPAGTPRLKDVATELLRLSSNGDLRGPGEALRDHLGGVDPEEAAANLINRARWVRRKYGFNKGLDADTKNRLQHFNKALVGGVPPRPTESGEVRSAQIWLGGIWQGVWDFYESHPTYRL